MSVLERARYIVIEGPIGVGKTTLARLLARDLGAETMLEEPEANPFLAQSYRERSAALPTQLFFLLQRQRLLDDLRQRDIFAPVQVADFLFDKDRIFAQVTLDAPEYTLYQQVFQHLSWDTPKPDLVVYLQAPVDVLTARIRRRGHDYEQTMSADFLRELSRAYLDFFFHYEDAPLLMVNAAALDPRRPEDWEGLKAKLMAMGRGREYYNPG